MSKTNIRYIYSWVFSVSFTLLFIVGCLLSVETYLQYLERQRYKSLDIMASALPNLYDNKSLDTLYKEGFAYNWSHSPKYDNNVIINLQMFEKLSNTEHYADLLTYLDKYLDHNMMPNYAVSLCDQQLAKCLNLSVTGSAYKYLVLLSVLFFLSLVTLLFVYFSLTQRMTHAMFRLTTVANRLGLTNLKVTSIAPLNIYNAEKALKEIVTQLERIVGEQMHMLCAISHDLKTPLTKAKLYADEHLLKKDNLKLNTYFDEIEHLLTQILSYTRQQHDQEPRCRLNLYDLLESECSDYQFHHFDVTLNVAANDQQYLISVQRRAFKRAVRNIIDNALKYAGKVVIEISANKEELVLCFSDNGPGIPEEILHRVCEPFYRVDSSRQNNNGMPSIGLGLSLVRTILKQNNIKLKMINRTQGGLKVQFIIPISR
ncbi:sensor histidine kinase [Cysteiniphilum sp. JM-1]|uniref:sensor histidine kinase n=1 Tax=Cysteiniphilum sp. JM-1 TaxID=2610891 RepID=UPI0012473802|nr:HAMP domain-containing sensor histidine kinase [Cysteiniphilum sp. JM-1]